MNRETHGETHHHGMVPPQQRSPWMLVLDLYRAGGSFRGFLEFALVGALVLAFLPGPSSLNIAKVYDWLKPTSKNIPATPAPDFSLDPSSVLPTFSRNQSAASPRISDIGLAPSYFDQVKEPLRAKLVAALKAHLSGDGAAMKTALADTDPENQYVLLLKGLDDVSQPSLVSLQSGIWLFENAISKGEPRAMAFLGALKVTGIPGVPRDIVGGRALLEKAAAAGDAPAARVLGEGFLNGWAGALDPTRAQQYLRLASERGDAKATYRLGEMLYLGQGVARNEADGLPLIAKAAEAGYDEAQAMFGVLRLIPYSSGLIDNPDEALGWFERAAAQGEPHAMFYLGLFYTERGKRIGRVDVARGVDYFRRCTEQTLYLECLLAYGTALDLGLGTPRDPVKAYALYSLATGLEPVPKARLKRDALGKTLSAEEIALANALATAMMSGAARRAPPKSPTMPPIKPSSNRLGQMLQAGRGVPEQHGAVERLFLAAANGGDAEAQTMMGVLRLVAYSAGLTNTVDEAVGWFERAAGQGEPQAMLYLGIFYADDKERSGRVDLVRIADLLGRCAETSFDGQCFSAYATALDFGIGSNRDPAKAFAMYAIASRYGHVPKARAKREELYETLSSEDIARGNLIQKEMRGRMPRHVWIQAEVPEFTRGPFPTADEIVQDLRRAAGRGDLKSMYRLGEILHSGRVGSQQVPKNPAEAERLFLEAATGGNADAQTMMGMLRLVTFSSGVANTVDEVLSWFRRAAAQGEPLSMIYLATLHLDGNRVLPDFARAADLSRRCSETSFHGRCLFAYATALDLGLGTTRDAVRASAMYSLAFSYGNIDKEKPNNSGPPLSFDEIQRAGVIRTETWRNSNVGRAELSGNADRR